MKTTITLLHTHAALCLSQSSPCLKKGRQIKSNIKSISLTASLFFVSSLFFQAKQLPSITTRSISDVLGSESSENGSVLEPRLVDSN
jgi:hypothetical protein